MITIIILLILAGISIKAITNTGLFGKANEAKQAQIRAEMKEKLTIALYELQMEKEGTATLDDVTQDWADNNLTDYNPTITSDASIDGKIVIMTKNGVTGKFLIDLNLNITEIEYNKSSIEFSYDTIEKIDNKVKILIHVRDNVNGLTEIHLPDQEPVIANGTREYVEINYEVEIGQEYKIKIISENGEDIDETILIEDYWYNITKNLGEEIEIDNPAIKAAYNKPYEATITTQGNYAITGLTVKMGGQAVTTAGNDIVDVATGKIYIEKVKGDIEITATSKVLEIITTTPYIGTSTTETDSTKSVADNSQTIGTTLYINIIANLEGTACTVTLKEDSAKAVPYAITGNGKFTFVAIGTYNGKTITKEIEVVSNKYQTVGGFVQYDAGTWTQEEIDELTTKKLYDYNPYRKTSSTFKLQNEAGFNFTFGGFKAGDSRNKSVTPGGNYGAPKYSGWQILESNVENGKVYVTRLIHAGSPENFSYKGVSLNDNRRAVYLMSNGLKETSYNKLINSSTVINPRNWNMYKDKKQLEIIDNVYLLDYDEALKISGDGSSTDTIRKTGAPYWLTTKKDSKYLYYVDYKGDMTLSYSGEDCYGIRPVVTLKSNVYIINGSGIEGDPYVLGMDATE